MFEIDKLNNMKLTRGNSLTLAVGLVTADGETYTPDASDVITFSMRADYADENPALVKTITDGELVLAPADTSGLDIGVYYYNMKITYADGTVDTFIAERTFEVGPNA